MKRIIRNITCTFVLAFWLTACGGGGGSGGGGTITYSGLTTPAQITTANAKTIFSLVWNGGNSLGPITSASAVAKSAPPGRSIADTVTLLASGLGKKSAGNGVAASSIAKAASMPVPIHETRPGMVSGTLVMSGSIDDTTGTGRIMVTFTNFNDGDGYTHNGTATMQIDGFDMTYGVMSDWTMSCALWNIRSAASDLSVSGSIRFQQVATTSDVTVTINMDGRDNLGKTTFRYQNFVAVTSYNFSVYPNTASESFSGRVYAEKFGYVDMSTVTPCIYIDPSPTPGSGGPIIFAGGGNSRAVITPYIYGVKIEVDENGDAIFESTQRFFWDNLTGPAFTSIIVAPAAPAVPAGLTQHFTATGTFSDNSSRDLTAQVTWTSSDTNIAPISSKEGTYSMCSDVGCAYAQSVGSSTITATMSDISGSASLSVTPAVLVSIAVHTSDVRVNPTIAIGMTQQFWAFGTFSNGAREYVTEAVAWSSSDNAVATISNLTGSNGRASSIASGTTTITAASGVLTGSTTLSVSAWTLRNSGTASDLFRVVRAGTQFVTSGAGGVILTSSDGRTFATRSSGTSSALHDVAWSGSLLVAAGADGIILTSPDGAEWTARASGTFNPLYGAAWSGTGFVAVGAAGTILTSLDGAVWTPRASGTTNSLHGVTWSGTGFVVVGAYGTMLTSPDGVVWTQQASGTPNHLGRVVWSGSQYVAVSGAPYEYGSYEYPIHTSPDGITWTHRAVAPATIWASSDVVWCGTQFVVSGADGNIYTSGDGVGWAPWITGTVNFLNAVSCSGTQFVAAGRGGMILSYP